MIKKILLPFLCSLPFCGFGVTLGNLNYDIYDTDRWGTAMAAVSSNTIGIQGDISIPGGVSVGGVQFNVTKVADNGFQNCAYMTSISLPPTLIHIGSRAFYLCTGLKSVSFPYSTYDPLTIGKEAFSQCKSLKSIVLPETTTSVGDYVFSQCSDLTSVTFPSSLKTIGNYAFTGCGNLVNVNVSSVTDWCMTELGNFESSPFSHNQSASLIVDGNKVTSLTPSSSTRTIGAYCFAGNCTLTKIELHENFNALGEGCFQYARNLSEITSLSTTPPTVGKYCFDGVSKRIPVHVPATALEAYRRADGWKDFTNYQPIGGEPETMTLTISPEDTEVQIGVVKVLTATLSPDSDDQIVWSSSNPEVAGVHYYKGEKKGYCTGYTYGKSVIRASLQSNPKVYGECTVTVVPVYIEEIILTPNSWKGVEGESFPIEATILPYNATEKILGWKSSDPTIAEYSKGYVNVLKDGECVITAMATDGSGVKGECLIMSQSGVEEISGLDESFDIYSISGSLIKKNADKEYLKQLTPSVYVLRSAKKSTTLIIR